MQRFDVRIHRILNVIGDKYFASVRKKRISNHNFSIICNNCWAGYVYRRYDIPYLTPIVGLYFFADDFMKLCRDVKKYMAKELEFISYTDSRYRKILEKRNQTKVPIARLGDIEIIFLHYSSQEEAAEKWKRRVERINYDNLIFKFSMMDGCTEEHLEAFDQLSVSKKICFVPANSTSKIKSAIRFKSATGEVIHNDTAEYSRYVNLTKIINAEKVCGSHMEGKWSRK